MHVIAITRSKLIDGLHLDFVWKSVHFVVNGSVKVVYTRIAFDVAFYTDTK